MIADDVYRVRLQAAVKHLRAWAAEYSDCADVVDEDTPDYWRLSVAPHAPSACPVELVLHRDQRFDAQIGDEVYESRDVTGFEEFAPLLEAVASGRVVTRTWTTLGTGAVHSVETIVGAEPRPICDERANSVVANVVPREACVAKDRHWLPYRR